MKHERLPIFILIGVVVVIAMTLFGALILNQRSIRNGYYTDSGGNRLFTDQNQNKEILTTDYYAILNIIELSAEVLPDAIGPLQEALQRHILETGIRPIALYYDDGSIQKVDSTDYLRAKFYTVEPYILLSVVFDKTGAYAEVE